jgi:uncharacterized protein YdeI (YjbR/CyaY-like superfamily)
VPEIGRTVRPRTREAWRRWLDANGARRSEVWLLLAKKAAGPGWLSYEEAVEEALCVGWIDGLTKTYDARFQALRFTPRRTDSAWSGPNRERVRRLVREGRMAEAGLALVRHAKRAGTWSVSPPAVDAERPPPDVAAALAASPAAAAHFAAEPPGQRRMALLWFASAKRPETRARRIAELVALAADGRRKRF